MKPEHRHELKENELAEWIANFPKWLKQNQRTIIYVSIFVVLIGGYWIWYSYQKNVIAVRRDAEFTQLFGRLSATKQKIIASHARGLDVSSELKNIAEQFAAASQTGRTVQSSAMALIEQADVLRIQLHYMLREPDSQIKTAQLNKAKEIYKEALAKLDTAGPQSGFRLSPTLAASAKFGIGLCEEELGNFDAAKNIYAEIVNNPDLKITTAAAQAQLRLDTMDDYKREVAFIPAPVIPPTVTMQPVEPNLLVPSLDIGQVKVAPVNVPAVSQVNLPGETNKP